ncbi:MAG: hypothetical protein ACFE85_01085 [Candidatus Hodarchaeota archaeon]
MVEIDNKGNQKNKISIGLIINKDDLNSTLFPEEVKNEIMDSPYYLLIFISREDVIKISCFPSKTSMIKKILIKLLEFSPDLVKGISNVLNDLNLSKDILHTTGICYELENCFYETYLIGDALESGNLTLEDIREKFMSVAKVVNVEIEDIPIYKNL